MSRIGRLPIAIPAGVTVTIANHVVTVKGPLGVLSLEVLPSIAVDVVGNEVHVTRSCEDKNVKALHGLYRATIANNIIGVTKGFIKELKINGVGYKVEKKGNAVVLKIGFSHEIVFPEPAGIKLECPNITEITVKGINKVEVGQCAANIKFLKKVEPYHGYGIQYKNEVIERKEGKTAGK